MRNFEIGYSSSCSPSATVTGTTRLGAEVIPVGPDGRFSRTFAFPATISGAQWSASGSVQGGFDATGAATGTYQDHLSGDLSGTHYECDTGAVTWNAR